MVPLGAVTGTVETVQPIAGCDLLEPPCGLGPRSIYTTEVHGDAIRMSRVVLIGESADPKRGRAECRKYAGRDPLAASSLDRSCDPYCHDRMQPPDCDLHALSGHGIAYALLLLLGRGADQVSSRFVYDFLGR